MTGVLENDHDNLSLVLDQVHFFLNALRIVFATRTRFHLNPLRFFDCNTKSLLSVVHGLDKCISTAVVVTTVNNSPLFGYELKRLRVFERLLLVVDPVAGLAIYCGVH